MTPRSTYQRILGWGGQLVVILILGFLILPAVVVTVAAFNDKAILSFPPQAWSWRWFERALAYDDFREGFRNGLIVTAWASVIALVVGAMFAFVVDRYRFSVQASDRRRAGFSADHTALHRRAGLPHPRCSGRMEPWIYGRW